MAFPPKTSDDIIAEDAWARLCDWTDARIALGRSGTSQRTKDVLAFQLDHANARDAVHQVLDQEATFGDVSYMEVQSQAGDRAAFLQRPDLGRLLSPESEALLQGKRENGYDVAFTVSSGLSSTAIEVNFAPFWKALAAPLAELGLTVAPLCFARQGRVALGDHVARCLNARMAVVLVGERPGLSSPDSMGIYLTYDPKEGTTDEARNCISNVRPAGMNYENAAATLCALIQQALARKLSGVNLKLDSAVGAALET